GYGHALKVTGKTDESVRAYRKAIELLPQSGVGYWGLANLKTFRFTSADIADMEHSLDRDDLSAETRAQLLFSLGKAHEDRKEYRSAFDSYEKGNVLWRSTIDYNPDETHAFVEAS